MSKNRLSKSLSPFVLAATNYLEEDAQPDTVTSVTRPPTPVAGLWKLERLVLGHNNFTQEELSRVAKQLRERFGAHQRVYLTCGGCECAQATRGRRATMPSLSLHTDLN